MLHLRCIHLCIERDVWFVIHFTLMIMSHIQIDAIVINICHFVRLCFVSLLLFRSLGFLENVPQSILYSSENQKQKQKNFWKFRDFNFLLGTRSLRMNFEQLTIQSLPFRSGTTNFGHRNRNYETNRTPDKTELIRMILN